MTGVTYAKHTQSSRDRSPQKPFQSLPSLPSTYRDLAHLLYQCAAHPINISHPDCICGTPLSAMLLRSRCQQLFAGVASKKDWVAPQDEPACLMGDTAVAWGAAPANALAALHDDVIDKARPHATACILRLAVTACYFFGVAPRYRRSCCSRCSPRTHAPAYPRPRPRAPAHFFANRWNSNIPGLVI